MNKQSRMEELVSRLNYLGERYYVYDDPVVSDAEYDALYDELVSLERELGLLLANSPTKRVGGEPIKAFSSHKHIERLYSLDKVKNADALREWAFKAAKALGSKGVELTVEHKLDGLTVCATYNNGELVCAATRGNGIEGEDITAQARTIRTLPLTIKHKGLVEVQGEAVMRLSVFNRYNKTAAIPLKNPRNGVAGAIRNLDPKVTAERRPDIYFYNINYRREGGTIASQEEMFNFLQENGFVTTSHIKSDDIEEIVSYIESVDRGALDYQIDGMVVKINAQSSRDALGFTDKFPRWAVAFKFEAEETTTKVLDVEFNVGRTGKVTPLAILQPVELGGVTISRATLNNMGDITRKSVKLGGRVFLRRSNDVIPEIMGAADDLGREIFAPTVCPDCGSDLTQDGAHLFCQNKIGCPAQAIGALEHFASKNCMDIEGLSEKTCELLYSEGLVKRVSDLYSLTFDQLLRLDTFKQRKAEKLLAAIERSKGVSLASFINALGIPNIGRKTAGDFAERFLSIDGLMEADYDSLIAIDEVGGIMATSVISFFEHNRELIMQLKGCGINPKYVKTGGALSGKRFVLTGTLPTLKRSEASALIEKCGGTVQSGVTKETDFLVAGEDAGSKLAKARTLGIEIISEEQLLAMLD